MLSALSEPLTNEIKWSCRFFFHYIHVHRNVYKTLVLYIKKIALKKFEQGR